MTDFYILNPSVIAKPLVNSWYAWVNYIFPPSLAMYAKNSHEKLINKFIEEVKLYSKDHNDSKKSSQFCKLYDSQDIDNLVILLEDTLKNYTLSIDLAKQIENLYQVVKENQLKGGCTVTSLYNLIPDSLKGMVEFNLDLTNIIQMRFIEPLFYKSRFFQKNLQSVLFQKSDRLGRCLSFLSMPQYASKEALEIKKPFDSHCYDFISKSRCNPISENQIEEFYFDVIERKETTLEKFKTFFVKTDLSKKNTVIDSLNQDFIIKYIGHACLLIKCGEINLLIDPQIGNMEGMSFYDLPDVIHFVLITHSHQDHSALESLIQIRHKIQKIIVPVNNKGSIHDPSLKLYLQNCGFQNVSSIDELEQINFPNGSITGIPFFGEHCDLNIYSKISYAISYQDKTILALSDSKNIDTNLYKKLVSVSPQFDEILIGMDYIGGTIEWLYQPLLRTSLNKKEKESRRLSSCNAKEAFELIMALKCKRIFIYAIGYKPWLGDFYQNYPISNTIMEEIIKLKQKCLQHNVKVEILLEPQLIYP